MSLYSCMRYPHLDFNVVVLQGDRGQDQGAGASHYVQDLVLAGVVLKGFVSILDRCIGGSQNQR